MKTISNIFTTPEALAAYPELAEIVRLLGSAASIDYVNHGPFKVFSDGRVAVNRATGELNPGWQRSLEQPGAYEADAPVEIQRVRYEISYVTTDATFRGLGAGRTLTEAIESLKINIAPGGLYHAFYEGLIKPRLSRKPNEESTQ